KGKKLKIVSLSNIGSELAYMEIDSWIRLIRVLTHEIMNSIAPVTSLTDTILSAYANTETSDNNDNLRENTIEALQTIYTTATGLMNFVKSYRRFTAIPKPQFSPLSLHSIIDKALILNASDFKEKDITLKLNLPLEKRLLLLDETQIMQVLQNLLKNATDAAPNKGKQIKIELSEEETKTNLDIANSGHPIPEEVLPNIFVPFFTTKEAGTGIGLSISRYIMRLHGGTLSHFTDNDWTVFRLTFQIQ
ncbi:MAG: HAMP domain-containing histidine kinase, partial [Bacteroidales bacterium]|nr:HAMP domain-containing histidine kinase [Bacteroidales bacterium]